MDEGGARPQTWWRVVLRLKQPINLSVTEYPQFCFISPVYLLNQFLYAHLTSYTPDSRLESNKTNVHLRYRFSIIQYSTSTVQYKYKEVHKIRIPISHLTQGDGITSQHKQSLPTVQVCRSDSMTRRTQMGWAPTVSWQAYKSARAKFPMNWPRLLGLLYFPFRSLLQRQCWLHRRKTPWLATVFYFQEATRINLRANGDMRWQYLSKTSRASETAPWGPEVQRDATSVLIMLLNFAELEKQKQP